MTNISKPIALDETLQATNTQLQAIANALGSELTPNRAVITDASGKSSVSTTTSTEIEYLSGVTSNVQTQLNSKVADVKLNGTTIVDANKEVSLTTIDNVTSAGNQNPLTANQGKLLNDRINNLQNIGRFLALWDCATGLPTTNPSTLPYTYHTGDYYRVGNVDATTNYMPNGTSYNGTASTTQFTETGLGIGAVFYYDGALWRLQASGGGGTVQDITVDDVSILSGGIANFDKKTLTFTKLDNTTETINFVTK